MISDTKLIKACDELFESELGKKIYSDILKCINDFHMSQKLSEGAILGLSGGADSVLLMIFLRKFKSDRDFKLKAVHINHMIRGEDADRDETFSKDLANLLGIDFASFSYDVPKISKELKCGLEEAARNVRYGAFNSFSREGYSTVITAHNATDNLETFIFNFMRGTGTSGLTAISPIRENVIRPLLYVAKEDIVKLLSEHGIPFCTDKTNDSIEYTRNYIRHKVVPTLRYLTPSAESASTKAIENLRCDADFIEIYSKEVFEKSFNGSNISTDTLRALHKAVFIRVIRLMIAEITDIMPEKIHLDNIYDTLRHKSNFEIDLPGNTAFFARGKYCYVAQKKNPIKSDELHVSLKENFTQIPELGIAIGLSDGKCEDFSSNVYNFSMKVNLSSAIIVGELYIRTKSEGDSYRYGGITRKLKKLFNDKKIPPEERSSIPVLCDDNGIVWVMGFGVREDFPSEKTERWLTVYKKQI